MEQYSQHNNTELSGTPNDIPEDNLEKVLIDICHDSGSEIEPKDIEGCHHLPVSRYSRDSNKRVTVKFVNRQHLEALLQKKNSITHYFLFICFTSLASAVLIISYFKIKSQRGMDTLN